MVKRASFLLAWGLVLGMAAPLLAHPWLTCASCAPGDLCCGYSCHGFPEGTIYVARFPARYQPAQTYCVKVGHNGRDSIASFNCSVKVGRGSVNAGRLQAGYLTETYSCSSQTIDGVRPIARCDTCNFFWTAPSAATDTVRLYLGGFQGIEAEWGYFTQLVLASAEEISGAEEEPAQIALFSNPRLSVSPNPFHTQCVIAWTSEPSDGPARLLVYDVLGREVRVFAPYDLRLAPHAFIWDGRDASGRPAPEGVYLFRLELGWRTATGKVLLIR
jgi:hypothetical protein